VADSEEKKHDFENLNISNEPVDHFDSFPEPSTIGRMPAPLPPEALTESDAATEPEEPEETGKKGKKKKEKKPKEKKIKEKKVKKERAPKVERETAGGASKSSGLMLKLSKSDPFTVMLGISLAALLIAILCCAVELFRYNLDTSAKEAKMKTVMTAPVDIYRVLA
jgi:outer membrane biosynthesis protein TonB